MFRLVWSGLVFLFAIGQSHAATTAFYFQDVNGQDHLFTERDGYQIDAGWVDYSGSDSTLGYTTDAAVFHPDEYPDDASAIWDVNFATRDGSILTAGAYYDDDPAADWGNPQNRVRRPWEPGQPLPTSITGPFEVLEVVYGEPDTSGLHDFAVAETLAVDFTQYVTFNDGSTGTRQGSLRVNSDIPLTTVPLPGAIWAMAVGLVGLVSVGRGRRYRSPIED